jgi:hypothetical protein
MRLFGKKQMSWSVSQDLDPGRDTEDSDYIRIKYVACDSLGGHLPVLSIGEFQCSGMKSCLPNVMEDRGWGCQSSRGCRTVGSTGLF